MILRGHGPPLWPQTGSMILFIFVLYLLFEISQRSSDNNENKTRPSLGPDLERALELDNLQRLKYCKGYR